MNICTAKRKSLTLAEAMITVALLAIVFTIVIQTYSSSSTFIITNGQVIDLQSKARHTLEWVAKDIRESLSYIAPVKINALSQNFDIETLDGNANYKLTGTDYGFNLERNNIVIGNHINSLEIRSNGHGYHLTIEVLSRGRFTSIGQLSLTQTVRSRND